MLMHFIHPAIIFHILFKASDFSSMDWWILFLSASLALVALCSASSCSRLCWSDFSLNVKSISWLLFSYRIKGDIRFSNGIHSLHRDVSP